MPKRNESTSRRRWPQQGSIFAVMLALSVVVQFMVLAMTFLAGLGWYGYTYQAACLQALVGVVAIPLLALRRTWLMLAVPVLSLALTIGLSFIGDALGQTGA